MPLDGALVGGTASVDTLTGDITVTAGNTTFARDVTAGSLDEPTMKMGLGSLGAGGVADLSWGGGGGGSGWGGGGASSCCRAGVAVICLFTGWAAADAAAAIVRDASPFSAPPSAPA